MSDTKTGTEITRAPPGGDGVAIDEIIWEDLTDLESGVITQVTATVFHWNDLQQTVQETITMPYMRPPHGPRPPLVFDFGVENVWLAMIDLVVPPNYSVSGQVAMAPPGQYITDVKWEAISGGPNIMNNIAEMNTQQPPPF